MAANMRLRTRIQDIQSKAESEREWWNKRREVLRAEFMKELDDEAAAKGEKPKSSDKPAPQAAAAPSATPATPAKTESVAGSTGSEEDGVWVEEGGPASPPTPMTPGRKARNESFRSSIACSTHCILRHLQFQVL
jgi:hypothetical protein